MVLNLFGSNNLPFIVFATPKIPEPYNLSPSAPTKNISCTYI